MMQMMNVSTLIDKAIQSTGLPSRAKATAQAGVKERERADDEYEYLDQSTNPSTGLSPAQKLPRRLEKERERADDECEYRNQSMHPSIYPMASLPRESYHTFRYKSPSHH